MKALKISFLSLLILLVSTLAYAQTVDDIVAKSIAAQGGEAAIRAANSLKIAGKVNIVQMGIELPFTRYQKRPSKIRMEAEFQGMQIVQVCDGTTCWHIHPFMGVTEPEAMPEEQATAFMRQADFDGPFIDMAAKGHSAELIGKETVDGKECYHIKLKYKDGYEVQIFVDSTTYLPYMMKGTAPSGMGGTVETVTKLSEYKKVGNFTVAHKTEQNMGGQEMVITIDEYLVNEPIDDSIFVMPAKK